MNMNDTFLHGSAVIYYKLKECNVGGDIVGEQLHKKMQRTGLRAPEGQR